LKKDFGLPFSGLGFEIKDNDFEQVVRFPSNAQPGMKIRLGRDMTVEPWRVCLNLSGRREGLTWLMWSDRWWRVGSRRSVKTSKL